MVQLAKSAARVAAFLAGHGLSDRVMELPESTRSAAEAASSIGCEVAQIAKSIVFRNAATDEPLLVVASGINRVDLRKIETIEGMRPCKADAEYIRARTGFVIGGVPPAGHPDPIRTYLDQDLLNFAEIWAAAGTPHAVFRLTPKELASITGGQWRNVRIS